MNCSTKSNSYAGFGLFLTSDLVQAHGNEIENWRGTSALGTCFSSDKWINERRGRWRRRLQTPESGPLAPTGPAHHGSLVARQPTVRLGVNSRRRGQWARADSAAMLRRDLRLRRPGLPTATRRRHGPGLLGSALPAVRGRRGGVCGRARGPRAEVPAPACFGGSVFPRSRGAPRAFSTRGGRAGRRHGRRRRRGADTHPGEPQPQVRAEGRAADPRLQVRHQTRLLPPPRQNDRRL